MCKRFLCVRMFVRARTRTRNISKALFLAIHLQLATTKQPLQGIDFFSGIQKGVWALFVDKLGLFWE